MKSILKILYTLIIYGSLCSFSTDLNATHIVGGEFTYKALGFGKYQLRLIIRRDCINGADSVYFDQPAEIGVFYGDNQPAYTIGYDGVILLPFIKEDTLQENVNSACFTPGQLVCVHEAVYESIITLPSNERGYILAYQRCCRNKTITNIITPEETGATFTISISVNDQVRSNSNPLFRAFPPIYVCLNNPFRYDHSASDVNGDSLVYSFCLPYVGRSVADPKGVPSRPPYTEVTLRPEYSISNLTNPGGTGIALKIDPITGEITGTPNTIGQYLIGICVTEYKNGRKYSYTRRDFQLNIVPCGSVPIAEFKINSTICDGLTQRFSNNSTNANSILWYFDFVNNRNATSTNNNPSYTYPSPGTYTVVLVAMNNGCNDTLRRVIKVANTALKAAFSAKSVCDPDKKIILVNNSTTGTNIISYDWTISLQGDPDKKSTLKDPAILISKNGDYTIKLVIIDENGCEDSISQVLSVIPLEVNLIPSKIHCKGDSIRLVINPNKIYTYTWSPTTGLDLSDPSNPNASPIVTTTYKVTITDPASGCKDEKELTLNVHNRIALIVTGDTITCDGRIRLMAMSDSTTIFDWSFNPSFNPKEFIGDKFVTEIKGNKVVYVRSSIGECRDIRQINLLDHSLNLEYTKINNICETDSINFVIKNQDPQDTLMISWSPDSLIRTGQGTLNPKVNYKGPGRYILVFKIKNQYGCELSDTIIFNVGGSIMPDFKVEEECGSLKVIVSTDYKGKIRWDFGDGKGTATTPRVEYTYMMPGKYIITLYPDTMCGKPTMQEVNLVDLSQKFTDTLNICPEDPPVLNVGANSKFKYQWQPDSCFVDAKVANPTLKARKTGWYKVTYYDEQNPNCTKTDSIYVYFVDTINIDLFADHYFICKDDTIKVWAKHPFLDSLIWCSTDGKVLGTTDTINVVLNSETKIIFKGYRFQCQFTDSITIGTKFPDFSIVGPDLKCEEDTIKLNVNPFIKDFVYKWTPKEKIIGPTDQHEICIVVNETTTYYLLACDTLSGCISQVDSHTVTIPSIRKDIFVNAVPPIIIVGAKTQLTTIQGPGYTYRWEPNDGSLSAIDIYNPIAMPMETTTYTVTVTDQNGCSASASITVVVNACEEAVFVPNAFSPNGDGKNEVFRVRNITLKSMELVVYNRWGQEMYKSNDINSGWDGSYDGKKLAPDVFAWHLRFTCPDDKSYLRKGNVSLLK